MQKRTGEPVDEPLITRGARQFVMLDGIQRLG
jgi:hypothetical protein